MRRFFQHSVIEIIVKFRHTSSVLGGLTFVGFMISLQLYVFYSVPIWWSLIVILEISSLFLLTCAIVGNIENTQVITSEPVSPPVDRTNTSLDNNIPNSVSEEEDKPPSYTSIELTYPKRTHQNQ
jgi:hypothetical protein